MTSLPRPTQKPRPKFYIAATQTPESFEFAGKSGYALMAIPIGPIGPLLGLYRKAWREAGHPGEGEVMVAFHMFCHEDAKLARNIARPPFEEYFRALNEAVGDWARHHLEGLSRLRQIDAQAAIVHARRPDRIRRRLGGHAGRNQGGHPPWSPRSERSSMLRCRSTSAISTCEAQKSMRLFRRGGACFAGPG